MPWFSHIASFCWLETRASLLHKKEVFFSGLKQVKVHPETLIFIMKPDSCNWFLSPFPSLPWLISLVGSPNTITLPNVSEAELGTSVLPNQFLWYFFLFPANLLIFFENDFQVSTAVKGRQWEYWSLSLLENGRSKPQSCGKNKQDFWKLWPWVFSPSHPLSICKWWGRVLSTQVQVKGRDSKI